MYLVKSKYLPMNIRSKFLSLTLVFALLGAIFPVPLLAQESAWSTEALTSFFGKTYKPVSSVSKKDFTKKLAQMLELAPEKDTACFKDLNKKDAASPFICALKKTKILLGSALSSFHPVQKTTWSFAIQTICTAKFTIPKKTLASCTTAARKAGFLALAPKKISFNKPITAKQLADFLTRVFESPPLMPVAEIPMPAPPPSPVPPASGDSIKIPAKATETLNFSPYAEGTIAANFFENVALTASLPNRFYKDEVYVIEGDLTGSVTAEEVFIFLCPQDKGCTDSIDFIKSTSAGGKHFKIPVHFEKLGNYQLGIIPGRSGESHIENISVVPSTELAAGGQEATALNVKYQQGETIFSWNGKGTLTQLIIFQDSLRQDYIFRQGTAAYAPNSADFVNFKKGSANWLVQQDSAQSSIQPITLTVQDFRKIEKDQIEVKSLQETFPGPGTLSLTAKALGEISSRAAVTLPSGKVQEMEFGTTDLPKGKEFIITVPLPDIGTYIFEVNNPQGSAALNVPIYVGSAIPLLPDYFTLHPPVLSTAPLSSMDTVRKELLGYINADRAKLSLPPVTLSSELNIIAQGHSQDMMDHQYFGHNGPDGHTPDDRRRAAKYPAGIRENLAKSTTIEGVEVGLMRSPVHRAAILDPSMTRVGIGIVKNPEGYILATQNFSADPLRPSDLSALEESLFQSALKQRVNDNLPALTLDSNLRGVAALWSGRMMSEDFFGSTDPQGSRLIDAVRARGITTSIQAHIVKASDKDILAEELLKQDALKNSEHKKIGIGLEVNDAGELYMTVIYTP